MTEQAAELRYAVQLLVTQVIEQKHAFGMTFAGVVWDAPVAAGELAYPKCRGLLALTDKEITGTIIAVAAAMDPT